MKSARCILRGSRVALPVEGDGMAHKVDGLHVQAVGVEQLLHGHLAQVIALEGPRVFRLILLDIPAYCKCEDPTGELWRGKGYQSIFAACLSRRKD